jgi:hypothetical protein
VAYLRTIKASFFTSEDVVSLSPLARLLYIGLWCEADREGRFKWAPLTFRLRYLPTDVCDVEAVCKELTDRQMVVLYGDGLASIPTFLAHQRPNNREAASVLPDPRDACIEPRDATFTRESRVREGKEREVEGKEREGKERAAVAAFPSPVPMSHDAWQETIADWNNATKAKGLPSVPSQPASWQRIVGALKGCPDLELWRARYERVAASAFCCGKNDRAWVADFWWVLEHGEYIDAGRYDDRQASAASTGMSEEAAAAAVEAGIAAAQARRRR